MNWGRERDGGREGVRNGDSMGGERGSKERGKGVRV